MSVQNVKFKRFFLDFSLPFCILIFAFCIIFFMLGIFKKKDKDKEKKKVPTDPYDFENMGMLQKMAMKKFMKMSPEEKEKVMKKVMSPDNIQKNKKELLKTLEQMEKSGQMNKHQIFEAKKRLGLL